MTVSQNALLSLCCTISSRVALECFFSVVCLVVKLLALCEQYEQLVYTGMEQSQNTAVE